MRRKVSCLLAATIAIAGALGGGCNSLSEQECTALRSEAYDILNEAHTCGEDGDCLPSEWPGCGKPLSNKNNDRIAPLRERFEKGSCEDQASAGTAPTPADAWSCPEPLLVYCKQGLCVNRHEAGEKGKTEPAAPKP